MNSREIVHATLDRKGPPRAARDLWVLPWAEMHFPEALEKIRSSHPSDFLTVSPKYHVPSVTVGNPYEVGVFVDAWGCQFENRQAGIIGEVKVPLIPADDDDWKEAERIHIPEEWLSFDVDDVNRQCAATDKFTFGACCPRPFEQMQFLRGTEMLYIDLAERSEGMLRYLGKMHDFYCRLLEKWAETDVDALLFMDDWGSQHSLLISPAIWKALFMPLYRDYVDIAHRAGKKAFMHSDGHILEILPSLVEMGLDALNAQIFCMGTEALSPYAGKIVFWGEIDRQDLLPNGSPSDVRKAVEDVHARLWRAGGCIAQCEFGPGARPENVDMVFRAWDECTSA
mgnify:CR=1 FL=1